MLESVFISNALHLKQDFVKRGGGERQRRQVRGARGDVSGGAVEGALECGEGCSPPTREGLGRVLCPSPEIFFLIFGSKWVIVCSKFLCFQANGGGHCPVPPPSKYSTHLKLLSVL